MEIYGIERKIAWLRRELNMRKRVYPGLIRKQRMTQAEMQDEMQVGESILQDYLELAQLPMFPTDKE